VGLLARNREESAATGLNGAGASLVPQSDRAVQESQVPQDTTLTKRDRNALHNMSKAARASS